MGDRNKALGKSNGVRLASQTVCPAPGEMRLRLLGGFSLELGGEPVTLRLNGQRLAAFLAIRGRVSRTVVAGNLWPDTDPGHGHGRLRTAIWRLQRVAPSLLTSTGDALALQPAVRVDVRQLDATGQVGQPLRVAGHESPWLTPVAYAAELLPGWYDDWVLQERERLRQVGMRVLETLALRYIADGRCAEALEVALKAVGIEPLRESAHRIVIAAHLAEDNVAEALQHYALLRRLLQRDLGVAPSDRTRAMFRNHIPAHRWTALLQ